MIDIDYILDLIDWNNPKNVQKKGLELAKKVKSINVFLQPRSFHGKEVWHNCAKILYEKSDEELEPYLEELFSWLEDLNWPGALYILARLKRFNKNNRFYFRLNSYKKKLERCEDENFISNLNDIDNKEIDETLYLMLKKFDDNSELE